MICDQCNKDFHSNDKHRRFCCLKCCWQWRSENKHKLSGAFKKGMTPFNKGTKGVIKPNKTSFKKGHRARKVNVIGDVVVRTHRGVLRAWVKVADNKIPSDWILRAVKNWIDANGPIEPGMVVHHIDRNTLNDSLDNLQLLTRAEHLEEHRHEYLRNAI